ncbi:hypothetical protein NIES4102_34770 [Chondrocystis sp. NIES-4102]|nr:hypothetical protein NIES4102_34770 [Chondrocystis sp. NIES-4102]
MRSKNNYWSGYILFVTQNKVCRSIFLSYKFSLVLVLSFTCNVVLRATRAEAETIFTADNAALTIKEVTPTDNKNSITDATLNPASISNEKPREGDVSFQVQERPIKVKKIKVVGNTLFKPEITKLTKEYQNKSLTLTELYKLRSAISKLYTDKGYVNSGAYLPPQKIEDGIVKIQVLEGQIETIEITGNKHLSDRYITSRLALSTPIKTEQILERLQLLRLDPLIENVAAELSAGVAPGMSRLDIKVDEADAFNISTSLDNYKSPSVGSNSRNLGLSYNNLLQSGDEINVNYSNTKGGDAFDIGYAIPVNAKNSQISFTYGINSNNVVEDPFTPLDIETKSNFYELSWRQPVINQLTQELALGLSFSRQHSETSVLDYPFPLSIGADEAGKTNISAIKFFQEYTKRTDKSVLALRSQFSLGVDLFDATINNNAPDSRFFAWRGQSQWVRQLNEDFLVLLRADLQLANDLVPLEQFRIGGVNSVRGYRRDISLSDSGLFTSAELRIPVWRIAQLDGVLQLSPFIDFGLPWSGGDAIVNVDSLVAIGMGLNFKAGEGFNARLDYGIPLTNVQVNGDSLQEAGVTFSTGYSF